MKVIGAGLPRTGTLSQKAALEMLGFGPCNHMVNLLMDLGLASQWWQALDGGTQWDQLLGGFESAVDWPASFFYADLLEAYPDAKVLLSVRDGESWAKSMRTTIWGVFYGDILIRYLSEARYKVDANWKQYTDLMIEMWRRTGLTKANDSQEEMSALMERYNQQVRAIVAPERLLVWSVAEGWEPLCEFLEVPVPEAQFPHLNDSKVFSGRVIDGSLAMLQEWRNEHREDAEAGILASAASPSVA